MTAIPNSFDALVRLVPTESPTRWMMEPSPLVLTPRGTLQGGAGLAAALLATERTAGRPALWATAQYLSYAAGLEPVQLDVNLEVVGHSTTQARCVLSRRGAEVLTAHVALGSRSFSPDGVWVEMPDVGPPEDGVPYDFFRPGRNDLADLIELRVARGRTIAQLRGHPGGGRTVWWCRTVRGRHPVTVGELAFVGDLLPLGFCEPYGATYAGNSIDNTLRVGSAGETEWILIDCHAEQVVNGFGHGTAYLWSQDGALLGIASQTIVVRFEATDGDGFKQARTRQV